MTFITHKFELNSKHKYEIKKQYNVNLCQFMCDKS